MTKRAGSAGAARIFAKSPQVDLPPAESLETLQKLLATILESESGQEMAAAQSFAIQRWYAHTNGNDKIGMRL
jgi:hypothetical protein